MKLKIFLVLLGCLIALVGLAVPGHAQDSNEALWRKVEDYFNGRYGSSDYILVSYIYQYQTWQDSSLNCPQAGMVYQPGVVEGYIWTIEINDNNIIASYEVHSNLDASMLVLCTPIDRARLINYRSYQNGVYMLDYPNTWQVGANEDNSQVIISPSGTENCADPGIKIIYRTPVGNANTMLDDALREAGLVQNIGLRAPVGNDPAALTALFEGPCGGSIVQFRASAFPDESTNSGHLILQWTTLVDYPGWSTVFMHMLETFRLSNATNSTPVASDPGEVVDSNTLLAGYPLAHLFAQDIFIGEFGDLPGYAITVGSSRARRGLTFSADGQYLAYIDKNASDGTERLDVVSRTFPRTTISRNILPGSNVAWSLNGATLAFLEAAGEVGTDGTRQLTVRSAVPTDAANAQNLGTIPFVDNCETQSTSYVPEQLYWLESGPNGNRFTLEWLPDGRFLYTTHCDGTGLAVWNPADNALQDLGDDLRRAALTVDRTKIAVVGESGEVYIIDLSTATRTPLPLEFPADQLAWSLDGQILYYSNIFAGQPFEVNDPTLQERAEMLLGAFPYESQLNTVTLIEYSLASGATSTLWQGQAYAIGRIVLAPRNAGLAFTLIPSDREKVMTFVQGGDDIALRFTTPETHLYWISASSPDVQLLAITGEPVFAPMVPAIAPGQ